MVDFQIPLPGLARDFSTLTEEEKVFIAYFSTIDIDCISPVVNSYAGIGPKGYGTALILARMIKIKERILSDRQLVKALKKNDLYRFVTRDTQPSIPCEVTCPDYTPIEMSEGKVTEGVPQSCNLSGQTNMGDGDN